MNPLSNRGLLAIAAVVDIALYSGSRNVLAKLLAARHDLPLRHLEPTLRALVQANILTAVRGQHGGYRLARERCAISAGEIVRVAQNLSDANPRTSDSELVKKVVEPAIGQSEALFLADLDALTIDDLCAQAEAAQSLEAERPARRPR
jgi:Rrf2 family protein